MAAREAARARPLRARRQARCRALGGWRRARVRELAGTPETLGAEVGLFFAFLGAGWSRCRPCAPARRRGAGRGWTPCPRPTWPRGPGRRGPEGRRRRAASPRRSRRWSCSSRDDAPERVNLLIPTIDLKHFFGGYIAKFNLARAAGRARRAGADRDGGPGRAAAARDWRRTVESYSGLARPVRRAWRWRSGASRQGLEVSRADRFVATTWWSAHLAHARAAGAGARALPLPDPGVRAVHVPDGQLGRAGRGVLRASRTPRCSPPSCCATSSAAATSASTRGTDAGDAASAAFQNAITAVRPPPAAELAARDAAQAALLRPARAPRRAQHVRAGRAGARPRAGARRASRRLGAARDRHGRGAERAIPLGGGACLDMLPAPRPGRLRRRCCATTTWASR